MKIYSYSEKKDTRSGFGAGLTQLGRTNKNNMNDTIVPMILKLLELISRSKR